ncbi:MAG: hypothetical protein ACK55Z_11935, partial [bacterium]
MRKPHNAPKTSRVPTYRDRLFCSAALLCVARAHRRLHAEIRSPTRTSVFLPNSPLIWSWNRYCFC